MEFNVLPASGRADPIVAAFIQGLKGEGFESFAKSIRHLILPSIALGLSVAGANMRMIRSAMLDVIRTDYIRFAKAKGLPPAHCFCQACFPECPDSHSYHFGVAIGLSSGWHICA